MKVIQAPSDSREWLAALEEVRPTAQPPGSKTLSDLMAMWNVKESQCQIYIKRLADAGKCERLRLGTKFYYILKK